MENRNDQIDVGFMQSGREPHGGTSLRAPADVIPVDLDASITGDEADRPDPSDIICDSFALFLEAARTQRTYHMSAGVNWQRTSTAVTRSLKTELEFEISYRNYGRAAGAKIVTDIISSVERDLAGQRDPVDCTIVNGATDGVHILLTYLLKSGQIDTESRGFIIGFSYPFFRTLFMDFGIPFEECICEYECIPRLEVVLDQIRQQQPKLIILTLPHNPTGIVKDAEFYSEIIRLAKRIGAFVLVDRVCLMPWELDLAAHAVFYSGIVDGFVFLVDSLSKSHSLAGIRVGYLLSSREHRPVLERIVRYRNLNPIVFGTPTLAFLAVASLAVHKSPELTHKFARLVRRYEKTFWADYPTDFEHPNLTDAYKELLGQYLVELEELHTRIDRNHQAIKRLFQPYAIRPITLDGGFNVSLEISQMHAENEVTDQFELAKIFGVCVFTERCFRYFPSKERNTYFIRLSLTLPEAEFQQGLAYMKDYYVDGRRTKERKKPDTLQYTERNKVLSET